MFKAVLAVVLFVTVLAIVPTPEARAGGRVPIRYPDIQIAIDALAAARGRLYSATDGAVRSKAEADSGNHRAQAQNDLTIAVNTLFAEMRAANQADGGKEPVYWSNALPGRPYTPALPSWTKSSMIQQSLLRHPDIQFALLQIDLARHRLNYVEDLGNYVSLALISINQAEKELRELLSVT
jgi:hypothetical protein